MNWYWDIETTTDHNTIRLSCAISDDPEVYDNSITAEEMLHGWLAHLRSGDVVYHYNGIVFDKPVMERAWGMDIDKEFKDRGVTDVDLYILSRMLFPDIGSHSLAAWAKRLFPDDPDKWKGTGGEEDISWYDTCDIHELTLYCRQDLFITKAVKEHFIKHIKSVGGEWKHAYRVEARVQEIVNKQKEKGVLIDQAACGYLYDDIVKHMALVERRVNERLPVVDIPENKLHYPPKKQFKLDGYPSAHLISYLEKYGWTLHKYAGKAWVAAKDDAAKGERFIHLPLSAPLVTTEQLTVKDTAKIKDWLLTKGWRPTLWNTKRGDDGKVVKTSPKLTDADKNPCPNLEALGFEEAKDIALWLTLRHRSGVICTSKGTGLLPASLETGTIASDADTIGTNTARFRHRNIVNIPRVSSLYGKELRSLFLAREGMKWVGWDASSLEACMEAHYTFPFDEDYAEALVSGSSEDGSDVHTKNMMKLGLDTRDRAKKFKYSVTYGAQPPKLAEDMNWSLAEAKDVFDRFWHENEGLRKFKEELEREWNYYNKRYIVGLDGRLISTRSKHSLINAKFQSGGAILMKHAMLIADKTIHNNLTEEEAYGLIRYHDEEQWECLPEHTSLVGKLGVASIEKAARYLNLNVPVTGEYKVGDNWAETH